MKLITGKRHLVEYQYNWMRQSTSPWRLLSGYADPQHIVCAVAGTRPMLYGECVYGNIPNKAGIITFYTSTEGVYELAKLTDGIHYYWERPKTKRSQNKKQRLPTATKRTKATADEPWHVWDEQQIKQKIYDICVDAVEQPDEPLEFICYQNQITHYGFLALFEMYGVEYYEFTNYKKIPEKFNTTSSLVKWPLSVSSISG